MPARAWHVRLSLAIIIAIGLFTYANSFTGLLVFDEYPALVSNANIRSFRTAFSAPPDSTLAGRPVTSLTFAANYALSPADSRDILTPPPAGSPPDAWRLLYRNLWGYHAVNLAIHLLAACALFGIVRRTLAGRRLDPVFAGAASLPALAVASIWVAHPLCTAAVTYVIQRAEALAGLFCFLTLYSAIRAAAAAPAVRKTVWTTAAVVSCALGMGSKEVMVSAPLIVVLYDLIFLDAPGPTPAWSAHLRSMWRLRWPLYLGLAGTWCILVVLVAGNPRPGSVGFNVEGWSSWRYLATQAGVIVHYLRLAVFPWPQLLDDDWPAATSILTVLPAGLFLLLLVLWTCRAACRRNPLAFLGGWFLLTLAPSSSFLPIATEIAAEHRMYLPLAAVVTLVVVGGNLAARRLANAVRVGPSSVARVMVPGCAAVAIVVGCASLGYRRNADYHTEEGIWAATVRHQPDNVRARSNYGWALLRQQKFADAEAQLRAALAIRDDRPDAHSNLGIALCSQGRMAEGIAHLRRAIQLSPDHRDAYYNLGEALVATGDDRQALVTYGEALKRWPDDVPVMKRLVRLLAIDPQTGLRNGRLAAALGERAVVLTGGQDLDALDLLGAAYAEAGRFPDAIAAVTKALAIARRLGRDDIAAELGRHIARYAAARPYRQGRPE